MMKNKICIYIIQNLKIFTKKNDINLKKFKILKNLKKQMKNLTKIIKIAFLNIKMISIIINMKIERLKLIQSKK